MMTRTKRQSFVDDGSVYPVTVDHSQTFDQMVAAGKYDEVANPGATSKEYPIVTGSGTSQVNISLLRFKTYLTSEQVVRRMKHKGYRPATVPELLALGAAYPHLQLEGDIIELGTLEKTREDDPDILFLEEDEPGILFLGKTENYGRQLWHDCWEQEWSDNVRFAAVPL